MMGVYGYVFWHEKSISMVYLVPKCSPEVTEPRPFPIGRNFGKIKIQKYTELWVSMVTFLGMKNI